MNLIAIMVHDAAQHLKCTFSAAGTMPYSPMTFYIKQG